jgi:hypothetical protein
MWAHTRWQHTCETLYLNKLLCCGCSSSVLQEALLALPQQLQQQQLPANDVQDIALQIYKGLADTADTPRWMRDLLSNHPVLLVKDRGQLCFRSARSSGGNKHKHPIYLADDARLAELFAGDCCLLAVPPHDVPFLRQLLQQIQPPPLLLSRAVRRSYAAAGGSAAAVSEQWTGLLRDVMPLICRCEMMWALVFGDSDR